MRNFKIFTITGICFTVAAISLVGCQKAEKGPRLRTGLAQKTQLKTNVEMEKLNQANEKSNEDTTSKTDGPDESNAISSINPEGGTLCQLESSCNSVLAFLDPISGLEVIPSSDSALSIEQATSPTQIELKADGEGSLQIEKSKKTNDRKITLMVWSNKDNSQLLAEFANKHPEISIQFQQMTVESDTLTQTQEIFNKANDFNRSQILIITDLKEFESKSSGASLRLRQSAQDLSQQDRTTLIFEANLTIENLDAAVLAEIKFLKAQKLPLRLQVTSDKAASTWQDKLEVSIDDSIIAKDKYSVEVDGRNANAVILQFKEISVYKTYTPKISIKVIQ